jgi:hypothetical protein
MTISRKSSDWCVLTDNVLYLTLTPFYYRRGEASFRLSGRPNWAKPPSTLSGLSGSYESYIRLKHARHCRRTCLGPIPATVAVLTDLSSLKEPTKWTGMVVTPTLRSLACVTSP